MDDFTAKKLIKDVDQIKKSLANVDKTLALQHMSLGEHMRRSQANEEAIEILKNELKPVVEHVISIKTVIKVSSWISGSGLVLYIISKFI